MLFGKVDVGGNIIGRPDQLEYRPWGSGFHGRGLAYAGRAADIRRATKARPYPHEHAPPAHAGKEDQNTISDCMKWLDDHHNASGLWMLYCSILLPQPPYDCTPDTESHVQRNISLPEWFTSPSTYPESS